MTDYVRVAVLNNDVEAVALDASLESQGIPHAIISYADFAFDGIFQTHKGWGYVETAIEDRDEVLEILESLRRQNPSPDSSTE